jgi:transposase
VDQLSSTETARRFGYTPGAFRVLCHAFRRDQLPEFFATARPGPQTQPKKTRAQEQIVALRKRNYSVYEISQALKEQGIALGVTAVREVLAQEGFAPLPRRLDEERPARLGPTTEPVADVRAFALDPGEFSRVRFHRRAHLPIVLASGLFNTPVAVPWWNGRPLRLVE